MRGKPPVAGKSIRVKTGSERRICHGVELENLVLQKTRVRRHVDFERGVRLDLVTFAWGQGHTDWEMT